MAKLRIILVFIARHTDYITGSKSKTNGLQDLGEGGSMLCKQKKKHHRTEPPIGN